MNNWTENILSNHVSLITKGTTPTSLGKTFKESGINFIKAESITESGEFILDSFAYIDEETHEILKRSQLHDGDILFSIAGVLGRIAIVNSSILPANTNQAIALIRLSTNTEIESDFLKYFLNSEFIKEQIRRINVQSAQANFSLGDINRLVVKYPKAKTEQRQIATILSTADAVIEKTQAAIAKFKAIKQGMLQDLFTRGIDTVTGKLRPSYRDAPELYKESKLGWIPKEWELDNFEGASELITDFTANGSFESLRLNVKYYYTIEYARLIRLTDLRVNLDNDGVFVDKEGYEFLSKSTLCENDIMLANVGEYTGFACLMPKVNYPATIAPNMFLIRCNKTIFNSIFMYYFMTLDAFTRQVDNVSASSATKLLNKTNFRTLSIHKPSVIEQEKIGNFLKAIDQKLKTEQDFLQKQQQIKAGLMNDLLSGIKKVKIKVNQMV